MPKPKNGRQAPTLVLVTPTTNAPPTPAPDPAQASLADLLAWAAEQLGGVDAYLQGLADLKNPSRNRDPAKLAQALRHFIGPVLSVVNEARARVAETEN